MSVIMTLRAFVRAASKKAKANR